MTSLFIMGDSTASIKLAEKHPETGWGEALRFFLKTEVNLYNFAQNGRSTKSFVDLGDWGLVLEKLSEGDFVLIQFGHNDQKLEDETRYTDPNTTYKENIKHFVKIIRERKAYPILLTSCSRQAFDLDGQKRVDTIGEYPKAMQAVSEELGIEFLDMYQYSYDLQIVLGFENSKQLFLQMESNQHHNYFDGIVDQTHFSPYGAFTIAELFVKKAIENNLSLVKLFNPLGYKINN